MNKGKLIKSYFDFLKSYGFKRKILSKNTDYEVVYSKQDTVIEVGCGLSISNVNNIDVDIMLKNSFYVIWIIIQKNNNRVDIFNCYLFDELSRQKLKSDIEKVENHNNEQCLKIYSKFIFDNIDKLFNQEL